MWDLPTVTFTFDALKLSLKTAIRQSPDNEWLQPDGLQSTAHIKRNLWKEQGPRKAFLESEKRYMEWFEGFTLTPTHNETTALSELEQLLDYCKDRDVSVRILIAPAHARYYQLLSALGLMDDIEELKRNLVELVRRQQTKPSTRSSSADTPTPIWDFSSANEFTSEEVPPFSTSGAEMQWYFDAVHFTPKLGEIILKESAGDVKAAASGHAEILTPETLDAALSRIRRSYEKYALTHPDDVAEIRRLVSSAEKLRPVAQRVIPR
jgi:hypothetical protein